VDCGGSHRHRALPRRRVRRSLTCAACRATAT
jgi:hypothetical protein